MTEPKDRRVPIRLDELSTIASAGDKITSGFLSWWRKWFRAQISGEPVAVPCGDCVECCRYPDIELHPESGDNPASYATYVDGDRVLLRRRDDGACIYLGDHGCTIYDRRPHVCRAFDCRIYPASRSIVCEPGTDNVVFVCEAAYRRFAIVARTPDDRAALNAVQIRKLTLYRQDPTADAHVLIPAALLSWQGPAALLDAISRMPAALQRAIRSRLR